MVRPNRNRNRSVKNWSSAGQPRLELLEDRLPPGSLFADWSPIGQAFPDSDATLSTSIVSPLNPTAKAGTAQSSAVAAQPDGEIATVATSSESAETTASAPSQLGQLATEKPGAVRRSSAPVAARSTSTSVGALVTSASAGAVQANTVSPAFAAAAPLIRASVTPQADEKSASSKAGADFANLSLYFEENLGQVDSHVDFVGRSAAYNVLLLPTEANFSFRPTSTDPGATLSMQFVGANPSAVATGRTELEGKVNYLIGNDPTQWHTCIPTFAMAEYAGVYPGIDVVYYGNGPNLEYDFVVSPGADPSAIGLNFEGADRLEIESDGDLAIHTAAGTVVQQKPFAYQESASGRQEVSSGYVLNGGQVEFALGAYDPSRALVIDPVVMGYAGFLGGNQTDQGFSIGVGFTGSAYITGRTGSLDLPTTPGAVQTAHGGAADGFVARLTPDGSGLVYATYLGGSLDDHGQDIAVDRLGNAYVVGQAGSSNFPVTPGAFQTVNGTNTDAFVLKLSPDGSSLLYSTYLGGTGVDQGNGIDINRNTGVAFVTGGTVSANFPTTAGAFQTTHGGNSDAFVTAINASGSGLVYSTYLGGSEVDRGNGLHVDGLNRVALTGETKSTNFPTTPGSIQTTFGGGAFDAFVARVQPTGAGLFYSTYLGGSGDDRGLDIAATGVGQVYVTGFTGSAGFPTTPGAFQTTHAGGNDVFVSSITLNGKTLVYSTFIGGSGEDRGTGIVIDGAGRAYVGGFAATNFPLSADALQTVFAGGTSDAIFLQLAANGASLLYSTYHGGAGPDLGQGVAIDRLGNIYLTGNSNSPNLPVTAGVYQGVKSGNEDSFVVKYTISSPAPRNARGAVTALVRPATGG